MARSLTNPFPGMNPWLEDHWHSIHARFLTYASDQIVQQLPAGLAALTEEQLTIENLRDDFPIRIGPDLAIEETHFAPKPTFSSHDEAGGLAVEEGNLVFLETPVERSLQIVDSSGKLITAIELFSPTNKDDARSREAYRRKQQVYQEGGVNLVEVDLISRGQRLFRAPSHDFGPYETHPFGVCIWRASQNQEARAIPITWQQRLPRIYIPLRPGDPEAILDLQAALDLSYERGRYSYLIDYNHTPRFLPPGIASWAASLLLDQNLRSSQA